MKNYIKTAIISPLIVLAGLELYALGSHNGYKKAKEEIPNLEIRGNNCMPRLNPSFELTGVKINHDGTDTSNMSEEQYDKLLESGKLVEDSLAIKCNDAVKLDGIDYWLRCESDGRINLIYYTYYTD